MPYGDPDPEDPNVLIGVLLPAGRESVREMAIAFAEEFAAMGFDEARLMTLFRHPHYAGAHRALEVLGEEEVLGIVHDSMRVWGCRRIAVKDAVHQGEPGEEKRCPR